VCALASLEREKYLDRLIPIGLCVRPAQDCRQSVMRTDVRNLRSTARPTGRAWSTRTSAHYGSRAPVSVNVGVAVSRIAIVLASLLLLWHPLNSSAAGRGFARRSPCGESGFIDLRFTCSTQSVVLPDGTKGLGLVFGGCSTADLCDGPNHHASLERATCPLKFFTGIRLLFQNRLGIRRACPSPRRFYKVRAID